MKVPWLLSCKHIRMMEDAATAGEMTTCQKCREDVFLGWRIREYRAKCESCRYQKSCGAAKLTAERYATKHHRRCPYHQTAIQMGSGDLWVTYHTIRPNVDTLTFDDDVPPY